MFNKIRFIVTMFVAIITLALGAGVQSANAAETFDDGGDVYSWYRDTAETGERLNLADIDQAVDLMAKVPYCDTPSKEYVACYNHVGDPDKGERMVDTLYWGDIKVVVVDDATVTITDRWIDSGIAACKYEDGSDQGGACLWDSATMGNRQGTTRIVYDSGTEVARY